MLYVLVHDNQVINGPRQWNYRSFESTLEEDLGITFKLPISKTDELPIEIDVLTKILPAKLIQQDYNSKIEYLHGPFWDFSKDYATGTYEKKSNDIEAVKNALKAEIATNRWKKECSGVEGTVGATKVLLTTAREGRDVFLQALQAGRFDKRWKFGDTWLDIDETTLKEFVQTIDTHIQTSFDWEYVKIQEIDTCSTLEDLDQVNTEK